jgi:hypothetical protein
MRLKASVTVWRTAPHKNDTADVICRQGDSGGFSNAGTIRTGCHVAPNLSEEVRRETFCHAREVGIYLVEDLPTGKVSTEWKVHLVRVGTT